jgi:hypothetical protein
MDIYKYIPSSLFEEMMIDIRVGTMMEKLNQNSKKQQSTHRKSVQIWLGWNWIV